jgi:hypothetical protein
MSTQNITITDDWTLVANAADDPVLITAWDQAPFEFATTDSGDDPPDVLGHLMTDLARGQGLTRAAIGEGLIYARLADDRFPSAVLVVSGSTVGDD